MKLTAPVRGVSTVRVFYLLTVVIGLAGSLALLALQGWRWSIAFLLGATISLGNLWLFEWLANAIAPGEKVQAPWRAGSFVTRYLILFAAGYVIIRALGVSPLPVVLGLFASSAAVLLSSVVELVVSFFPARRT